MKNLFQKVSWQFQPTVFWGASIIVWGLVFLTVFATKWTLALFSNMHNSIVESFGWFYILTVGSLALFCIYLLLSRFGGLRLGRDDEKPIFSFWTWIAMLFSAGMGIGIMFYGVAEPVMHLLSPPNHSALRGVGDASKAMRITFFHWGLHAWAIYAVVGLAIAYSSFRKGRPFSIRYTLQPLLGKQVEGPIGHLVDILAIVGTLFGVATSLGLGVAQINSGLNYLFGIPEGILVQIGLIALITGVATISVVTGLKRGIRILSEVNISAAVILLGFIFFSGTTSALLNHFVQNIGNYLQSLPALTFHTAARTDGNWVGNWTIFYWAWWIAWSPFVGMFIARISLGRTIREFVAAVLIVPSLFTFLWMTVFGESAMRIIQSGESRLGELVSENLSVSLFAFLEYFPMSPVVSLLAMIVIIGFFVTSSDSGSLVIDMIASGGKQNPPVAQRIYWAIVEGVIASILLFAGGLGALQMASINVALPFTLVIILMCIALLRDLARDSRDSESR